MVWVASVISYKSSMRWLLLGQFDEMSKYDCYSNICDEMSKFEVSIYQVASVISYKFQWDDCYSNNCHEMSKFEVSIWSKMVWVRASVII